MNGIDVSNTRWTLGFFMLVQPLGVFALIIDKFFGDVSLSRETLMLLIALPWGLAIVTILSVAEDIGVNTGSRILKWILGASLVYATYTYALKEIYLIIIIPIGFLVLPLLSMFLSYHFFWKARRETA
ncbi:MAG: hypothetical protein IIB00_01280 [candidate division Zixibacteria bacterium]|nr:hypothetical protein [candidate division Zixibacteria bacterium]